MIEATENGPSEQSVALAFQMRAVPKSCLRDRIRSLTDTELLSSNWQPTKRSDVSSPLRIVAVKRARGVSLGRAIRPVSGSIWPATIRSSVDVPAPFGPTRPTRAPLGTNQLTSSRTTWLA